MTIRCIKRQLLIHILTHESTNMKLFIKKQGKLPQIKSRFVIGPTENFLGIQLLAIYNNKLAFHYRFPDISYVPVYAVRT